MDIFSNRELATAFWIFAAFIWLIKKPGVQESIKTLFSVFIRKYILILLLLMLTYVSAMVATLHEIGIWDASNLKNTILWTIFVASVTLFRGQQSVDDPYYFTTAIKDNFKIIVIFEFIVNFYSFNIFAELIIVAVATILIMVQAFSENKEEYAPALKLSESLLSLLGTILLFQATYQIVNDITLLTTFSSLNEFVVPIIMSIMFLPFMYIFITYLAYERTFMKLRLKLNNELVSHAKLLAIISFGLNRILLSRWSNLLSRIDIETKQQLVESINKVKRMQTAEKRCTPVNFEDGWSPYKAKHYLSDMGLTTKFYDPMYDDLWFSSAPELTLEDESPILCNNIGYNIEGSEKYATSLKLILDVNKPSLSEDAHHTFLEACKTLTLKSLNTQLSKKLCESIINGKDSSQILNGRTVTIERHDWVDNWKDCYDVKFKICFNH